MRLFVWNRAEGATSEGEFFESLNWAARESLPVFYVIQNNGFAISVPQQTQTGSSIQRIAEGFGVKTLSLDGLSFEEIYAGYDRFNPKWRWPRPDRSQGGQNRSALLVR